MAAATPQARRRPSDRRDQIVRAARVLIAEKGYHAVSMAQIAGSVGITAGALYRHFPNKAVLLGAVIGASFDEATPSMEAGLDLTGAVAMSCRHAVSHRDVGPLWWRESRNLPADLYEDLRKRLHTVTRYYAGLLRVERPKLSEADAVLLAWGVQSILASPGAHSSRVPEREFAVLLAAACRAVCAVDLLPRRAAERRPPPLRPASMRERLLLHAVALFEERGYAATGLDDIGASAGVTGPNLYGYFQSKADLLQAAIERGTNALWLRLGDALRDHDSPRGALVELAGGYARLALDKTGPTSLLYTDQAALPEAHRDRQREYVGEWTALLAASRPDLGEASARVLVHTALGVVNTMVRIEHLRIDAAFPANLTALATAVLFSG